MKLRPQLLDLFILAMVFCLQGCHPPRDIQYSDIFEAELLEADSAFAAAVAAADPQGRAEVWSSWFCSDGQQVIPGGVVQGHEQIEAFMHPAFLSQGFSLTWSPDRAESSADGTSGWTSGRYATIQGSGDQEILSEGRYVTIWKKEDGKWLVSLDTGVPDRQ